MEGEAHSDVMQLHDCGIGVKGGIVREDDVVRLPFFF
jgi:hypothetical protein